MTIFIRRAAYFFALLITLSSAPLLRTQQSSTPSPAPIPSQILDCKKIFISNASGETITPNGSADLTYNQFYASLKNWGHYKFATTPYDADLVLEIRYETPLVPATVPPFYGYSQVPQLRLTILDPRTHIILWAFTEPVRQIAKKSTGMQNFEQAMDTLISDLKSLTSPRTAP